MAEYIERKATCEDCIHYDICIFHHTGNENKQCVHFKNKADVVEIPQSGIGDLSDGYHTFNELYHHRAILFSIICNSMPEKAWKSKLHDTGDMYDGMFIVGIETPKGQATYHYDTNPYWDMFNIKELEKAPKWDGHTPQEAIDRISTLVADVVEVRHGVGWTMLTAFGNVSEEWIYVVLSVVIEQAILSEGQRIGGIIASRITAPTAVQRWTERVRGE